MFLFEYEIRLFRLKYINTILIFHCAQLKKQKRQSVYFSCFFPPTLKRSCVWQMSALIHFAVCIATATYHLLRQMVIRFLPLVANLVFLV